MVAASVRWAACRALSRAVRAEVRLEALPLTDPLARARAEGNVVVLLPERGAEVIVAGKGAGRLPTAGSLIGDLNRLLKAQR